MKKTKCCEYSPMSLCYKNLDTDGDIEIQMETDRDRQRQTDRPFILV